MFILIGKYHKKNINENQKYTAWAVYDIVMVNLVEKLMVVL